MARLITSFADGAKEGVTRATHPYPNKERIKRNSKFLKTEPQKTTTGNFFLQMMREKKKKQLHREKGAGKTRRYRRRKEPGYASPAVILL